MNDSTQLLLLLTALLLVPASGQAADISQRDTAPAESKSNKAAPFSPGSRSGTGASSAAAEPRYIQGPGGVRVRPRAAPQAQQVLPSGTGAGSGSEASSYSEEAAQGETRLNR